MAVVIILFLNYMSMVQAALCSGADRGNRRQTSAEGWELDKCFQAYWLSHHYNSKVVFWLFYKITELSPKKHWNHISLSNFRFLGLVKVLYFFWKWKTEKNKFKLSLNTIYLEEEGRMRIIFYRKFVMI